MSLILNITSSERTSIMKPLQAVRPQPRFLTIASCISPSCQSWHLPSSHYFAHLFPELPVQEVSKESRREEGRGSRKAVSMEVGANESAVTMETVLTVKSLCWMVHGSEPGEWMLEMMEPSGHHGYWAVFTKASYSTVRLLGSPFIVVNPWETWALSERFQLLLGQLG